MVCGTLYLNIASFFPTYVTDHYGSNINTTMVSICIAIFNVGGIIGTIIHPKYLSIIGRKNCLLIGFVIEFICTVVFGMTAYLSYD